MIKVESLTVQYKNVKVLNNISLNIKKGDVIAIAGKNGAGKTTLLKSIVGLITPNIGNVEILGSIGWMPEDAVPDPKLKVHEFISFCAELNGSNNIDDVITKCGLEKYRNQLCKTLSKGLKQRVLFACVLVGKPEILILDEPSGGLDPLFQNEMIKLIKGIGTDVTIILSTHNISEINSLASEVVVLKDGEISYKGLPEGELYYEYF